MLKFIKSLFGKSKGKKESKMENNKELETKTDEVEKKVEETETETETEKENNATNPNGADEKKTETEVEVEKETETPESEEVKEEVETPVVEQTTEQGNGIRVEDLVTKDLLAERLQAMESKMEALIKENKDLTEKLSSMSEKYEEKDFGTVSRKGVQEKNSYANETFDEYSKQFL
jgi:hypothetical protein